MESFLHTSENTLQILFLCPTQHKQKFHWNLLKRLFTVDQHLPSSTNIHLPYQFEQPHMYYFESRLEVSAEETPHVLGSEDGFQYIQHEVPNKSRCQIKLIILCKHQWNTRWAFAQKPGIFTCKNNMLSSHVKISPLLWLHNKSRLSHQKLLKWNGLVVHWCLYNK